MSSHSTLRIIRNEHGVLVAVLRSIDLLLAECRRHGRVPDFTLLRAMLFYIDEFPERVHHPKESELLFPRIRQRTAALTDVLERLDADHARSHAAVRELEHDVLELEMMSESADSESRQLRFETSVRAYIASYLEHIRAEEIQILPLAERVLSAADWAELDAAFTQNRDPLTLHETDDALRPLFLRILTTLPSPIGLGPTVDALRNASPAVKPGQHGVSTSLP